MRRLTALAVAALTGATLALAGATPASAANVRYVAVKACTVDGKKFSAYIKTWGKPTPATPGVYTKVQIWAYKYQDGLDGTYVEALKVVWRDGAWQYATGVGYTNPVTDGDWHHGPSQVVREIGYLTPTMPAAYMIRGYTRGELGHEHFCHVILRPYDLVLI